MVFSENRLKPSKGDHSIKEVVVSVFVAHQIDIEELADVKLSNFSHSNRKVEIVKRVNAALDAGEQAELKIDKPENTGIRFLAEEDGNVTKLMQGINEFNRTYLSYHNFNYKRWQPFLEEYLVHITEIASNLDSINAEAFSLYYVDEFEWDSEDKIESRGIFNVNSRYLPSEFFNVFNSNSILITEKLFENNVCYDRIEISVDNNRKIVKISHNLTRVLTETTPLISLIKSAEFSRILNWAHEQNKFLLKEVLHQSVQDLIKLK
jgi:uncharacterized protein (TIGR04255 family)